MKLMEQNSQTVTEKSVDMLKALGHPIRLQIVRYLISCRISNVTQIQTQLDIPQSTVSVHLAKLKSTRVLKSQRRGLEMYYQVADKTAVDIVTLLCN
ncbi:ArsR/SmtB family transcription factor [Bacillus cereus]